MQQVSHFSRLVTDVPGADVLPTCQWRLFSPPPMRASRGGFSFAARLPVQDESKEKKILMQYRHRMMTSYFFEQNHAWNKRPKSCSCSVQNPDIGRAKWRWDSCNGDGIHEILENLVWNLSLMRDVIFVPDFSSHELKVSLVILFSAPVGTQSAFPFIPNCEFPCTTCDVTCVPLKTVPIC